MSAKEFLSTIYKELWQLDKNTNNTIWKVHTMFIYLALHKEYTWMMNKWIKSFSTSLVIRKMQIKIMIRYLSIVIEWLIKQNKTKNNNSKDLPECVTRGVLIQSYK